ncbi:MAG: hypothetical protein EXS18_02420 [Verrucomicrobiae bacterium]|nr:hypothetical protein [Verrucomicrobiae bacterium]
MKDKQLEKNIQKLEAFLETWKQFNHYLQRSFRGETFTDEDEDAFLDLKSTIAQEYETVMMALAPEVEKDEKTLRILIDAPSLRSIRDASEGMSRRVESEWHTTFIKLQTSLGRLKAKRIQLASVSSIGVVTGRVMQNPIVILFIIVVIGAAIYRVCDATGILKSRNSLQTEAQPQRNP